jgi:hypothetical protein
VTTTAAAFWPLLAMVELVALLAAVLICVALGVAGLAVQLRRRRLAESRATEPVPAGPSPTPVVEQDDDNDPVPS